MEIEENNKISSDPYVFHESFDGEHVLSLSATRELLATPSLPIFHHSPSCTRNRLLRSTMPSSLADNPRCQFCSLHSTLPMSEPPAQQIIVHSLPTIIHCCPNLSSIAIDMIDATQLKPIDLSVPLPVTNMTLDTDVADSIWEMNTNRMMSEPGKIRSNIPVSHCRNQLRLARKQVLSKLGVPSWSEEKKLLTAVRNADASTVIHLLQNGVDPNTSDGKKRTALHIAASQRLDDIVSHLVAARADPNRQDILGNAPLHLAVCRGDMRTVNILLRNGADINQKDNVGRTPLCIVKSRLGTLRRDKSISTDKLISECQMISDMLKVHCNRQPGIGTATEGSDINVLCNMVTNISTREQADEIADNMIEKMSQLCILNTQQAKDNKLGYVLSIL